MAWSRKEFLQHLAFVVFSTVATMLPAPALAKPDATTQPAPKGYARLPLLVLLVTLAGLLLWPLAARAEGCVGPNGCVVKTKGTTVTTTAAQIDLQTAGRDTLCVWNNGSVAMYLGFTSAVTSTVGANGGFPLAANSGPICFGYGSFIALFAVTASGTTDARVLEQGGLGRPAGSPGVVR